VDQLEKFRCQFLSLTLLVSLKQRITGKVGKRTIDVGTEEVVMGTIVKFSVLWMGLRPSHTISPLMPP
jgi:hypothetical protein